MPTSYAASRTIAAPPATVWALLTDARGYPAWNPTVVSIGGTIEAGQRIVLVPTLDPKRTLRLRVAELDPPRRMVWASGMPLGLFKGVRTFALTDTGRGTSFRMEEVYSGPLAPIITAAIPDLTESFEEFAEAVKVAAEKRTAEA